MGPPIRMSAASPVQEGSSFVSSSLTVSAGSARLASSSSNMPAGSVGSWPTTATFISFEIVMPCGSMYPATLVRLLRPHFAVIGLVLFVVGALYASALGAAPSPAALAAGYLCMLVGHLAIHAVNDYFDREDDRHGTPTPFSGGSGVLQEDPGLAPTALAFGIGLSALSLIGTALYWLVFGPNPWFAGLIVAGLLLGWAYSAPPLRFSARGLGEVSTALAFVLMPGFGYAAAAGDLDAGFVPLALPLLLLGFSFIFAVEFPDLEADTAAGRRNFTVRHGRSSGRTRHARRHGGGDGRLRRPRRHRARAVPGRSRRPRALDRCRSPRPPTRPRAWPPGGTARSGHAHGTWPP